MRLLAEAGGFAVAGAFGLAGTQASPCDQMTGGPEAAHVRAAWAAKRAKASYDKAQFFRLKARRGPQKVICAVVASILLSHASDATFHGDGAAGYFDKLSPEAKANRLVKQMINLGYRVSIQRTTAKGA
jgi:hypothetical protein